MSILNIKDIEKNEKTKKSKIYYDFDDKKIGDNIKNARIKKSYTQEMLAEKVELSCKYISRLEKGMTGIRLEMLADESFVLHKDDFNLHDEIIKACKHTGFQPHIVFETSQRDLMLQTVSADLAIALLPSRLCPEVGENTEVGSKVVVRPLVPEIIHTLYVIWKKGHYLSHASRLWLDFVNSKLPLPGLQLEAHK